MRIGTGGVIIFAVEVPEQQHNETFVQSVPGYNEDAWHHVAGVREGSHLYLDGQLAGSEPLTIPMNITHTAPIVLGMRHTFTNPLAGTLDEIRLWSVPRSPQEIADHANVPLVGNEAGLVGYWRLHAGCTEQSIQDFSVTRNDGWLGEQPASTDHADPTWVYSNSPVAPPGDIDGDDRPDPFDNCPAQYNPD